MALRQPPKKKKSAKVQKSLKALKIKGFRAIRESAKKSAKIRDSAKMGKMRKKIKKNIKEPLLTTDKIAIIYI